MDSAFAILRGGGNTPWSLRREVLRTLGILGALDPYRYQQIQLFLRARRLQEESIAAVTRTSEADANEDEHETVPSQESGGMYGGPKRSRSTGAAAATAAAAARKSRFASTRRARNMLISGVGGNEGAAAAAAASASASGSFPAGSNMPGGGNSGHRWHDNGNREDGKGHGLLDDKGRCPPPMALLDQANDEDQARKEREKGGLLAGGVCVSCY